MENRGGRGPAYLQELVRHWWVLPPTLIGVGIAGIPAYTAGLFLKPLEAAFGWSRAMASGGHMAVYIGIALSAPFVGVFLDRFGARRVALFSMLALAAGYSLLALQPGAHAVFLAIFLTLGVLGTGASAITMTRIVSSWFERARGLALGLILTGSGLCSAVVPPVVAHVMEEHGWRWGYGALAILVLAATPLTLALREGPLLAATPKPEGKDGKVLTRPAFWLLSAAAGCMVAASVGLVVHVVPILSGYGYGLEKAAEIAGLMGLMIIAARLATGFLLDHLHPLAVASGLALLGACGYVSVIVLGAPSAPVLALANGLILGAEYDVMSFLVARYFGVRLYARAFGVLTAVTSILAATSPVIIGALFDASGSYTLTLMLCAGVLAAAAPLFWLLGRVVRGQQPA